MKGPIRAVIVDDEPLARDELRFLLTAHPDVETVGEAESVQVARALIAAKHPDVVFLDVELRGESGFDLVEEQTIPCKVIFVTSFDEYAIRALEVQSLDYLLKPVNPLRLAGALGTLRHVLEAPHS